MPGPERSKAWRALMLLLWAVLAALEFVIGKVKDWVEEQIVGEKPDDEDEDEEKK